MKTADSPGRATMAQSAAAAADYLVFLNNDTVTQRGWLDSLLTYSSEHLRAAIVGSKLLFPDRVHPARRRRNLTRRPSAEPLQPASPVTTPAVCKSRPLQAVTAACCLVRRDAFSEVGGFDEAFRNGYEDVDLCLRFGELGYEVHYCAASKPRAPRGGVAPPELSRDTQQPADLASALASTCSPRMNSPSTWRMALFLWVTASSTRSASTSLSSPRARRRAREPG